MRKTVLFDFFGRGFSSFERLADSCASFWRSFAASMNSLDHLDEFSCVGMPVCLGAMINPQRKEVVPFLLQNFQRLSVGSTSFQKEKRDCLCFVRFTKFFLIVVSAFSKRVYVPSPAYPTVFRASDINCSGDVRDHYVYATKLLAALSWVAVVAAVSAKFLSSPLLRGSVLLFLEKLFAMKAFLLRNLHNVNYTLLDEQGDLYVKIQLGSA